MPYCFTILTILHIGSLTPGETTDYGDIALHSAILVFRSVLSPVITLNQNIIALLSYLYQLRLRHRRSAVFINCASNAFSGSEHLLSHLRPQHFLAHSTGNFAVIRYGPGRSFLFSPVAGKSFFVTDQVVLRQSVSVSVRVDL
jgi:hypothetical protein